MIKLEVTQQQFDTILAALWHVKSQLPTSSTLGFQSPAFMDMTNLMARIGNQRDKQVRAEAIAVHVLAEEMSR